MKVLVFGRETITGFLIELLTEKKLDIIGLCNGSSKATELLNEPLAGEKMDVVKLPDMFGSMIAMQKHERFDLAIVDGQAQNAEIACNLINDRWNTPVVLIVGGEKINWDMLRSLGADGYILERAGRAEIAARLRAILRRFYLGNGFVQQALKRNITR
ncbi:hypothetical protein ACFLTS_06355 [Chloroflexota bacterium]